MRIYLLFPDRSKLLLDQGGLLFFSISAIYVPQIHITTKVKYFLIPSHIYVIR